MKKICWLSWLPDPAKGRRTAGGVGAAILLAVASVAIAQTPAPDVQSPTAPKGYTVHETVNLGGRISSVSGSGAMYDTMVNEQSGPRVLGETFQMHALPGARNTLFDSLTAVGSGFGGDPYSFAKMDFYKGKLYQFSGLFRRDRQYFDYDLLGNPNIPSGQSTPVTGGAALPWAQVNDSPFLNNSVRRMTDTNLTLFPLSIVSFRAGYSQDIFAGPSLTPSGFWEITSPFVLVYDTLLQEMQRNSTDDFFGAVDWKPVPLTKLSFEEQVDHYKADSYFILDPALLNVQESDGTKAALAASYDSLSAPTVSCNANSVGTTPPLSAPNTPGGLPVVNPACSVVTGYQRYQPTRILYPTEIFRLQSSSIRNVSMNGDVRYTSANMNLPNYYENLQGLLGAGASGAARELIYTNSATAKREVMAADYGIEWTATEKLSVSDQVTFSNVQQPGSAITTSAIGLMTPATAGNETIAYTGKLTSVTPGFVPGNPSPVGTPNYGFFGQRMITNDVTASWNGWSRATLSLTYRHRNHIIAEGESPTIAHNTPLTAGATQGGTVTINQDGGILNLAVRPTSKWDINGSAELSYSDNVFTPMGPRQLQHYRAHTLYRAKSWATVSGAYNDMELHNNTNNMGAAPLDGPLDHVAHSRIASVGAQVDPNERYGFDLNYSFSDIYMADNICYDGAASAAYPGAATASGTACPGATVRGTTYYEFGPVKDFVDAPTNYASAALRIAPTNTVKLNVGYRINDVDGSRFYNDPRDVAGALVSTWQSGFAGVAWTVHPGWIWNVQYQRYDYDEGGASGAPYCSTGNPTPAAPAAVVGCASSALGGAQTGLTLPTSGETASRTFQANNVTLGFHYEF